MCALFCRRFDGVDFNPRINGVIHFRTVLPCLNVKAVAF